jgi:hypothetical protein
MRKVALAPVLIIGAASVAANVPTVSADIQDCATNRHCHYRDSYLNARAFRVYSYQNINQGGASICTSGYHFWEDLASIGFNDKISSAASGSTYTTCP